MICENVFHLLTEIVRLLANIPPHFHLKIIMSSFGGSEVLIVTSLFIARAAKFLSWVYRLCEVTPTSKTQMLKFSRELWNT